MQNSPDNGLERTAMRSVLSWLEIAFGVALLGVGLGNLVPLFQDAFGDPHGMGATLGLTSSVIGCSFLIAGLFLRLRHGWTWILQGLPVLAILAFVFLLT